MNFLTIEGAINQVLAEFYEGQAGHYQAALIEMASQSIVGGVLIRKVMRLVAEDMRRGAFVAAEAERLLARIQVQEKPWELRLDGVLIGCYDSFPLAQTEGERLQRQARRRRVSVVRRDLAEGVTDREVV